MRFTIILLGLLLATVGCSKKTREARKAAKEIAIAEKLAAERDYSNQETYNVSVGDTVEIYFETNSCCYICVPNQDKYNHLLYIGEKSMTTDKNEDGLCLGCNSTYAELFVAKSVGTDTVKIGIYQPANPCILGNGPLESFVVNVIEKN